MRVQMVPDSIEKLARMGDVTPFEPAGSGTEAAPACYSPQSQGASPRARTTLAGLQTAISTVTTPAGPMPVLKTMVTTACERNCFYCTFRAGRGRTERITLQPDELAQGFDQLQRARMVNGLFLSSGIIGGGVRAQDKIIATAEILRHKYAFRGFMHLKVMPGADYEQVRRTVQLADRVSVNLEAPTPQRLQALAPKKEFWQELLQRLQWIDRIRQAERLRTSIATQFVVGAVGDTDLELLELSGRLYRQLGLSRVYYSAFRPVSHTPFAERTPVSSLRQHRLYQASFLLRDYRWDLEELAFDPGQMLRLDLDPKQVWAEAHLRDAPVELASAERERLLRVPGIGPVSAAAILNARRQGSLRELAELRALGVAAPERAAPYILLNGRRPGHQLALL